MTPERWQQVKDIFDRAVECEPASRLDFIRECCGGDEELRKEVESLLASDPETGSLLDNPLMETGTDASAASKPAVSLPAQGDSFGAYVPVRVLGEGGMGTVYLARQQHPIRREVALKVVKLGMDSRQVLERFESERQVLALMEHPNVARVLDAGTSERGRPYFVMEYVDGVPITQYCDRKVLSTRERLQLFIPVCNALQHAHKKGIIHRDVKPSNVLVTEVDGKPVPKVIDFGIARATDQRSAEGDAFTMAGQIVGTPEYMSPEQAGTDSRDIDTGTDVYSLGVVLYELLVGALPLDMKALRRIAFGEVLRAIRETPVPKPTARITQMGAAAEALALQRSTNPGQLKRDLSGDLDCIVMKAIDKDRQCRYASASEFGADIERFLNNEPVLAGPPGAAYRMRKFVVRHKRPVAAAAAVVLALIAGTITTAWQARVAGQQRTAAIRARAAAEEQRGQAEQQAIEAAKQRDAAQAARERAVAAERTATMERDRAQLERNTSLAEKRRADQEAATATAVNDFLQNDLLAQASPNSQVLPDTKPDPDLKVRTALDRAAAHIASKFDTQPLVEASIRLTIGSTYMDLGLYMEAQREFERAVDLRRRVLGEEHADTLTAMNNLGVLYRNNAGFAQAEALFSKVLEVEQRVLGEKHPTTLNAMINLGVLSVRAGKYAQSEALLTKSLEIGRRVLGEGHPDMLLAAMGLEMLYGSQGKWAQAETLATKVLEVSRRVRGEEHPDTLNAMFALGALYAGQGKYAQAEPLFTKAVEVGQHVLGEEHFNTLSAMSQLGMLYQMQGKYAEAEPLLTKVMEVHRRVRGVDFPETLIATTKLGMLYQRQGKYVEAEPLLINVMEVRRRVSGEEHPETLTAMNNLGMLYQSQGKWAQAEPLLIKVMEVSRRVRGEEYPATLTAMNNLGVVYFRQGKDAQAEPLFAKFLEVQRHVLGEEHPATLTAMNNLARLYRHQGKDVEAEPLLTRALEVRRRVLGPNHPSTTNTKAALAGLWLLQREYTFTEPLLREALNDYEKLPDGWERYLIQSMLGGSLAGQRRYPDAEPLLLSGYQGIIQREATIPGNDLSEVEAAADRIVQLYHDWGKSEQAAEWRAKIDARKAAAGQKQ